MEVVVLVIVLLPPKKSQLLSRGQPNLIQKDNSKYTNTTKNRAQGTWIYCTEENSGRGYWYNDSTFESVWDDPDSVEGVLAVENLEESNTGAIDDMERGNEVWTYHIDETTSAPYWYNNSTGASHWIESTTGDSAQVEGTHVETSSDVVWEYLYDHESGMNYWYNSSTGESKWVEASLLTNGATSSGLTDENASSEWEYHVDEESGGGYWYNTISGESEWVDNVAMSVVSTTPGPDTSVSAATVSTADAVVNGVWEYLTDSTSGRPYWWNATTGESSWADEFTS